jgi:hypothetical protein
LKGRDLIRQLKTKFRVQTDAELARQIGVSIPNLQVWKNRQSDLTCRQIAELTSKAHRAGQAHVRSTAIRPIVEFFPINKVESRGGAKYEVFSTKTERADDHPYLGGLRAELQGSHGLYIFFDSRGQAIYVGKAEGQDLWKEVNLAFNRERGELQSIKRVRHPNRRQQYRTSDEKARQITDVAVPLHELARYFSTYEVVPGLIGTLEAMLVRSFANNLLNKRMERFPTAEST